MIVEQYSMSQTTLEHWASSLANYIDFPVFIGVSGPLGAGKSTFARAFLRAASGEEDIPSPTFALVQQYQHQAYALPMVHADLFRITAEAELHQMGFTEMLTDALALVEWPCKVHYAVETPRWDITLDICAEDEDRRDVRWEMLTVSNTSSSEALVRAIISGQLGAWERVT